MAFFHRRHHDVIFYSSPGSRMCELVKAYFVGQGIDVQEHDVTHDANALQAMIQLTGQNKTPVVVVDGRVILGYYPELFELALRGKVEE